MIQGIKEVKIFILSHLEDNMSLPDTELINYATINTKKTGIYSKALACWNTKATTNCIVWENFRKHMIAEYEKLLAKYGGTTLAQKVYGAEFHTMEETDNNDSLVGSIVEYAERATVSESKTS